MTRTFVSGVVEGFYGRPWNPSQRLELFKRLEYMGLNTYLYAPKDDAKHRQLWRDLYSQEEIIQLKYLIDASKRHNITFVYAISPGIDITFSSVTDTFLLKQKMQQVLVIGCEAFSLLFDDISPNLGDIDKNCFPSVAIAQASLTNDIFVYLKKPKFFLFCPTEYCATRAVPSVLKSDYLSTIGANLRSEIDIMWTGPKVISNLITLDSVLEIGNVLKRRPIIWDNIHANDYDQTRLFLGPYCGRSSSLIAHIRGVLTNPNCEFEANFVALHTLAQWTKSTGDQDDQENVYKAPVALQLALVDWIDVIYEKKDSATEYKNSISHISFNDNVPHQTQMSAPATTTDIASKIFSSEQSSTVSNYKSHSKLLQESAKVASTSLVIIDPKEDVPSVYSCDQRGPLSPLTQAADPTDDDVTNISQTISSNNFTDEEQNKPCNKLHQQFDMESMDNNINLFPLTPMETEDTGSDTENVIDPMAMQVDCAEDGHCETMDVIDEENNPKVYTENDKDCLSPNTEESEMEDTISNESIDLAGTSVCNSAPKLTIEDLNLLVHLFFLPYEHGPLAIKMLELIYWIISHGHFVSIKNGSCKNDTIDVNANNVTSDPVDHRLLEWHLKAKEFQNQVEWVRNLVDRLCNIPNRNILFDLYPYIQDLRHVLGTLNSYVKWMGSESGDKESFVSDDPEPWMFRGGLISELQRMLPLEGSNDLFPSRPSFLHNYPRYIPSLFDTDVDSPNGAADRKLLTNTDVYITNNISNECLPIRPSIFMIRPYHSSDITYLYDICFEVFTNRLIKNSEMNCNQLEELKADSFKELVGDRYIGHFLQFSPESCMVLENEDGDILGYSLCSSTVNDILTFRRDEYAIKMQQKYQSKIDSFSPVDIPLSKSQTVVKSLLDGFFDNTFYKYFQEMKDKPQVVIHLDMMDGYKETDLDAVSLSRRLLSRICSVLKIKSEKNVTVATDAEPLLKDLSLNQLDLIDGYNPKARNIDRKLEPMMICCELDSLSKCHEDFYKRCGFIKCNVDEDNFTSVSVMARNV